MDPSKRRFLLETTIFRFYVTFRGSTTALFVHCRVKYRTNNLNRSNLGIFSQPIRLDGKPKTNNKIPIGSTHGILIYMNGWSLMYMLVYIYILYTIHGSCGNFQHHSPRNRTSTKKDKCSTGSSNLGLMRKHSDRILGGLTGMTTRGQRANIPFNIYKELKHYITVQWLKTTNTCNKIR